MLNYKKCKNCCYLFEDNNKKWCCDCYERYCEDILNCPQIEDVDEVEFTIDNKDKL